jgi:hypothetical protein
VRQQAPDSLSTEPARRLLFQIEPPFLWTFAFRWCTIVFSPLAIRHSGYESATCADNRCPGLNILVPSANYESKHHRAPER